MVSSRVFEAWRNSVGLKDSGVWDPDSLVPPPCLPKLDFYPPRPKFKNDYKVAPKDFLPTQAFQCEFPVSSKSTLAHVGFGKLEEWENAVLSALSIINMIAIFHATINNRLTSLWDSLSRLSKTSHFLMS